MEVKMKDTKAAIYEAYVAAKKELDEMKASTYDPEKERKEKEVQSAVDSSDEMLVGLGMGVGSIKEKIMKELNGVGDVLADMTISYDNLLTAIKAKEEELKELTQFEEVYLDCAAAVNAREAMMQGLETSLSEKKDFVKAELAKLDAQLKEYKKATDDEYLRYSQDMAQKRKRDEDEYQYNLNRDHKRRRDELEDNLAILKEQFDEQCEKVRAEMAEQQKALSEREEAIANHEEVLSGAQARISYLEAEVEKAKADGEKTGHDKAAKEFSYEKRALTSDYENRIAILESKLEDANSRIDDLKNRNYELSEKLEAAHNQNHELAAQVVNGMANQTTIESMKAIAQKRSE